MKNDHLLHETGPTHDRPIPSCNLSPAYINGTENMLSKYPYHRDGALTGFAKDGKNW